MITTGYTTRLLKGLSNVSHGFAVNDAWAQLADFVAELDEEGSIIVGAPSITLSHTFDNDTYRAFIIYTAEIRKKDGR